MENIEINENDLLTPYSEFEKKHSITKERSDIPKRFIGFCPSKYYKLVDMDVDKLRSKVDGLLHKFLLHNPQ